MRDLPRRRNGYGVRPHRSGGSRHSDSIQELPGTTFEILSVDDGAPGKKPVVSFSVKDKEGKPILPSEMARLALVLSGPTTDYGGDVTEDVRATATGSNGNYTYTFTAAVPAAAKGSFAIGIEGYRNITIQRKEARTGGP